MKRHYLVAFAAGLVIALPASLTAQTTTTEAPAASPAAPAPAASPAAPEPAAPAASPAPASSPSASAPPAETPASDAPKKTATKKKKSGTTMTRQQEIDHSIDSGTVPSRYRSQVPKEYQQYIPFDKR